MNCTRCGRWVDFYDPYSADDSRPTDDLCDDCADAYMRSLRAEYPYGYCGECGAPGKPWTCPQSKTHITFNHSEGGCSQWRDVPDTPDHPDDRCACGCTRDQHASPFSRGYCRGRALAGGCPCPAFRLTERAPATRNFCDLCDAQKHRGNRTTFAHLFTKVSANDDTHSPNVTAEDFDLADLPF